MWTRIIRCQQRRVTVLFRYADSKKVYLSSPELLWCTIMLLFSNFGCKSPWNYFIAIWPPCLLLHFRWPPTRKAVAPTPKWSSAQITAILLSRWMLTKRLKRSKTLFNMLNPAFMMGPFFIVSLKTLWSRVVDLMSPSNRKKPKHPSKMKPITA